MQKRPEDGGEDRKREDRRVRRTRASIRRAFLDLLDEKSYGQITVTELSERADINRKTFYAYYSGMDELLRELEQDLMEDYEEVCTGRVPTARWSYWARTSPQRATAARQKIQGLPRTLKKRRKLIPERRRRRISASP